MDGIQSIPQNDIGTTYRGEVEVNLDVEMDNKETISDCPMKQLLLYSSN